MMEIKKSALDKLSLEVRRMIYKELLVNPKLGTMEAIGQDTEYGQEAIYGLTPAILRTSHRIYEEAPEILYDQTFIINCDFHYCEAAFANEIKVPCPCPLLRYIVDPKLSYYRLEIPTQSVAMTRARSWKVFVDSSWLDTAHNHHFYEFCRAICKSRPKKIEVIMLKTGNKLSPVVRQRVSLSRAHCMKPWITLAPLTMLRNVGKLTIKNEYPPYLHKINNLESKIAIWESNGPGKVLRCMLQNLVQNNQPVERLFEMRYYLVKLAQSFERYIPFKLDMNFRTPLTTTLNPWDTGYDVTQNSNELDELGFRRCQQYDVPNPNRTKDSNNDLEAALLRVRNSDVSIESRYFKAGRERIIGGLRLHYGRLVGASRKLKEYKARLEVKAEITGYLFTYWLVLIENYAKEFEREKSPETLTEFRRQKRRFDNLHATWPREMMLVRLDRMMEEKDFEQFAAVAEEVEADMDRQVTEIENAWKDLYKADVL